jgi:hypothetical protein
MAGELFGLILRGTTRAESMAGELFGLILRGTTRAEECLYDAVEAAVVNYCKQEHDDVPLRTRHIWAALALSDLAGKLTEAGRRPGDLPAAGRPGRP